MTLHRCPIEGCTHQLPTHILMCKPHWAMVPKHVQQRVYKAWNGGAVQNIQDYLTAKNEAINSVHQALGYPIGSIPEQIKSDMTLHELREIRNGGKQNG